MEPEPRKLLDQVRDALRLKHYSIRTEQAYVNWIKRFIFFHHKRHPRDMGVPEVEAFLSYLAVDERVAASPQNQARSALVPVHSRGNTRAWERGRPTLSRVSAGKMPALPGDM